MRLCATASPKYSSGDRRLVAVEIAGQPTPDVPFRPQFGWVVPRAADIRSLNLGFGWVSLPPAADIKRMAFAKSRTTTPLW